MVLTIFVVIMMIVVACIALDSLFEIFESSIGTDEAANTEAISDEDLRDDREGT